MAAFEKSFIEHGEKYHIVNFNLKRLFMTEEFVHQCSDGVDRLGIFIPYEPNYITHNRMNVNLRANVFKTTMEFMMKHKNCPAKYVLLPYRTESARKRLEELGYKSTGTILGFMNEKYRKPSKKTF
jgi:hypothetical protein